MRYLRAVGYGLGRAVDGLRRAPATTAAVTGAIAVGFTIVGLVHLMARNMESTIAAWGGSAHMVVYLEPDTTRAQAGALSDALARVQAVERVQYIPAEAAFDRLRHSLGEHDQLLDGIDAGMLPASIEVTLRAGLQDVAKVHPKVRSMTDRIESAVGVEEVVFVGHWADKLALFLDGLRYAVWCLFALMGLACVYLVATTIRLRAQGRREEVEVMRLFGASGAFVRGPLMVEGMLLGAAGAGLAMVILWVLFYSGADAMRQALSQVLGTASVGFLPTGHVWTFIVAGAMLGLGGSWTVTGERGRGRA